VGVALGPVMTKSEVGRHAMDVRYGTPEGDRLTSTCAYLEGALGTTYPHVVQFRQMATFRDVWLPKLESAAPSRSQVLAETHIADHGHSAVRPINGRGSPKRAAFGGSHLDSP
jgi:hypothetical protein